MVQWAVDLYVKMGFGSRGISGIIDWINEASFEVIETAHEMMQSGIAHEQIIAYALAKIIGGAESEVIKEQLQAIQTLIQEKNGPDYIKSAIKHFGKDVFLIAEKKKDVSLKEVMEIKYKIDEEGNLQHLDTLDTIETIIGIASIPKKNNTEGIEESRKIYDTLKAGFTIKEIEKYPFLISSLVTQ